MPALINGINFSWSNVTLILFGVPVIGITKIDHKTKQKKDNNYGAGYEPVSRGYGMKEYEGSIEIYTDELKRIIALAPNRDLMQIPPFQIQIAYQDQIGGLVSTDILEMCEFMEEGLSASQGDTKLLTTLPLVIGGIKR